MRMQDNNSKVYNCPLSWWKSSGHYHLELMLHQNHVPASGRIASELLTFIEQENITSIHDFGAGVGQYEHAILCKLPDVEWNSYDGAGNTEEYTVRYS